MMRLFVSDMDGRVGHRALSSERPITVLPNGGDRYLSDRFWREA
jgi:hypothetical protein